MARSSDLVPLLSNRQSSGTGFRQGVIVSWNPDNAENTVSVGGTVFTNLPILNTTEASLLAEGDVVAVMTYGSSFAIMGRVVIPGSAEAVSSIQAITNRIQAAEDIADGYRNSTSWGDLTGVGVGPEVTVRIGSSGRALVFWSSEIGQTAAAATPLGGSQAQSKNTPHVGVQLSGANTAAPDAFTALNTNLELVGGNTSHYWIQSTMMHLFTGLDAGDTTFTLKYRHDGMTPSAVCHFQTREIAVFAL